MDTPDLAGKVALVTGGSRGIGAATARALAAAGATVVITHRDSVAGADDVWASMGGEPHRVVQASAADTPALEAAAASVASIEGRLDIVVNNAATTRPIPHADLKALDDDFFDEILRVNVRGAFATIRAFRDLLVRDGGGVVINISSLASRMGNGSNVAYCASKAAMDNMTMSLGRALAPEIRVLSVAPGLVETQLTKDWSPESRRRMLERTPLGRLASAEDVAAAVLAAVTMLPSTTGVVIPVDGGLPLG